MDVFCKKGDFPYTYTGFRGQGCFHPVALPSRRVLETSAFSQNEEKEVMEKEHVLLRVSLVAEGAIITWLTCHWWELHMGFPPRCKELGDVVLS